MRHRPTMMGHRGVPAVSPASLRRIRRRARPQGVESTPLASPRQDPLNEFRRHHHLGARPFDRSEVDAGPRFTLSPLEVPIPATSIVQKYSKPGQRPFQIHEQMDGGRLPGMKEARTASVTSPDLTITARGPRPIHRDAADVTTEMLNMIGGDLAVLRWHLHYWGTYAGWAPAEKRWERIQGGPLAGLFKPRLFDVKPWRVAWKYPDENALEPQLYARRASPEEDVPFPADRAIWYAPRSRSEPYGWLAVAVGEVAYAPWELERLAMIDWAGVVAMISQVLLVASTNSPTNANAGRADELMTQLQNLRVNGDALLLKEEKIESLTFDVTSGGNTAGPFIDAMQRIQAAIVFGETDSQGLSQGQGTYGARQIGARCGAHLLRVDATMLDRCIEDQVVFAFLEKNFGTAVAIEATPYVSTDLWDLEDWKLHQEGLELLLRHGAPVDRRDLYKMAIRGRPPAEDADVFESSAPEQEPPEPVDPAVGEFAVEQDIAPGEEAAALTRTQTIIEAHKNNTQRRVRAGRREDAA